MILPFILFLLLSVVSHCDQDSIRLQKYLLSQKFEGRWKLFQQENTIKQEPWSLIQNHNGVAVIHFIEGEKNTNQVSAVEIDLLMPQYYDENVLRLSIAMPKDIYFNIDLQRWETISKCTYFMYNYGQLKRSGNVSFLTIVDQSLISIKISQNFYLTLTFQPTYLSPYTSFFFGLLAYITLLLIRRKNKVQNTQIRHQLVSLVMCLTLFVLISVCEIIIGFRSLFGKMSPEAFLTVAGFINLAVCYQFVRFYSSMLFISKWSIILIGVISGVEIYLFNYFQHNHVYLLVFAGLSLMPQILYHCFKGQKIELDARFIICAIVSQLYVLYFKACPHNLFKQSAKYILLYSMPGILLLQTIILVGQAYLGSRFFIPSILLPVQYNYYDTRNVKTKSSQNLECHICLQHIKIDSKNKRRVMITPCNHIFHADCLEKWMAVQMKCPVDRYLLPPF